MEDNQERSAFVLRIAPSGKDRVGEALEEDEAIIGWSECPELLNPGLTWEQFRELIRETYHPDDDDLRRAGNAAGHAWCFIRDMKPGDLIVTPHGPRFYVARIIGDAVHREDKVADDTAFRRRVEWLNGKQGIERSLAKTALQLRMKIRGTSANATELVGEIEACLAIAERGEHPEFTKAMRTRLIDTALKEIRGGHIENFGFERLVAGVMQKLGADDVKIVPRLLDKGVDILATFLVAGTFQLLVAIQAKHYQPEPPVGPEVVEQLIQGMAAESANLGMVVTCGTIGEQAEERAARFFEEEGIRIELVDGELLASMIVQGGISSSALMLGGE